MDLHPKILCVIIIFIKSKTLHLHQIHKLKETNYSKENFIDSFSQNQIFLHFLKEKKELLKLCYPFVYTIPLFLLPKLTFYPPSIHFFFYLRLNKSYIFFILLATQIKSFHQIIYILHRQFS